MLALTLSLTTAFASGDTNIDGGGGGMDDGNKTSYWNVGDDGIRVSVIHEPSRTTVAGPVDFTNTAPANIEMSFVKKSKLDYKRGAKLALSLREYKWLKPASPIPPIISSGGRNNIAAVKEYFSHKTNIEEIADKTGMPFEKLTSGKYVLLLEPVAYFTYNGQRWAMSATEAALRDQILNGKLKQNMGYLTHQNLPLSMFLERPDLGYEAWKGAVSGIRPNTDIIASLGLGTVRFTEGACCDHPLDCPCITNQYSPTDCECKDNHPDVDCGPDVPGCDCVPNGEGGLAPTPDYTYRTDTDVITSVMVYNNSSEGISPDDPASVTFSIGGRNYTRSGIIIPPNESQLVWVKWRTPDTPQSINITVRGSGGLSLSKGTITANIEQLVEKTPPNTEGTDLRPGFVLQPMPDYGASTLHRWSVWWAWWHENWVWVPNMVWVGDGCDSGCAPDCGGGHGSWEDHGEYVDKGWWVYESDQYSAGLGTVSVKVVPDERVKTEKPYSVDHFEMKSGYGINAMMQLSLGGNFDNSDVTPVQNVVALFPEFDYTQYNRLLVPEYSPQMHQRWTFAPNPFSQFNNPVHFTPIWFPDRMNFEPYFIAFDAWTPVGQLYIPGSDYVYINGNVYDDWHIAPI